MLREVKRAKRECRNKQITAVFKPSKYAAAQKVAYIQGCSPNNILNIALEEYLDRHQNEIAEYDKLEAENEEE